MCLIAALLWSLPAQAKPAECGDKLTEQGHCATELRVEWCEKQSKQTLVCKPGTVCAWNDKIDAFDCVSVADECVLEGQQVSVSGECYSANSAVRWCDDGKIKSLACSAGSVCGWNDAIEMMDCIKNSCGTAAMVGHCTDDGRAIEWCENGRIITEPCDDDEICIYDKSAKAWGCAVKENGNAPVDRSQPGSDASLTPPKNDTNSSVDSGPQKASSGCAHAPVGNTSGLIVPACLLMLVIWRRRRETVARRSL
jgi:hypothetical protein